MEIVINAGIRNLRNALEANFTELSGYMYPCVQSSYFARVEGIECLDPAAQIDTLVASLEENVAKLELYNCDMGTDVGAYRVSNDCCPTNPLAPRQLLRP